MRRNSSKKGFTIVELVIVIAVIAILAGVLIPTFTGLVEKANESARQQLASAAYREAYALALADDGKIDEAGETETAQGITFVIAADGSATGEVGPGADDKLQGYDIIVDAEGVIRFTEAATETTTETTTETKE